MIDHFTITDLDISNLEKCCLIRGVRPEHIISIVPAPKCDVYTVLKPEKWYFVIYRKTIHIPNPQQLSDKIYNCLTDLQKTRTSIENVRDVLDAMSETDFLKAS